MFPCLWRSHHLDTFFQQNLKGLFKLIKSLSLKDYKNMQCLKEIS